MFFLIIGYCISLLAILVIKSLVSLAFNNFFTTEILSIIAIIFLAGWLIEKFYCSAEQRKNTLKLTQHCNIAIAFLIFLLAFPFLISFLLGIQIDHVNTIPRNFTQEIHPNFTQSFLLYSENQKYVDCVQNLSVNSNITCTFNHNENFRFGDLITGILFLLASIGGYIFFLSFIRQKANFFFGLDEYDSIGAQYYVSFFYIASNVIILGVIAIAFTNLYLTSKFVECIIFCLFLTLSLIEMKCLIRLKESVKENYKELDNLVKLIENDKNIKEIFNENQSIDFRTFLLSLLVVLIFFIGQLSLVTFFAIAIIMILNYIIWCQLLNLPTKRYVFIFRNNSNFSTYPTGYILLETNTGEFRVLKEDNKIIKIMKSSIAYIEPVMDDNNNTVEKSKKSPFSSFCNPTRRNYRKKRN